MDPAISHHAGVQRVVERRLRQWELQGRPRSTAAEHKTVQTYPYVALSRSVGSGATEVADMLHNRLGWDVYDKQILEHMAADDAVRRRLYALMDERHQNWLDEILRPITIGRDASRNDYLRRLRAAIAGTTAQTPGVFLGRGAVYLLPPERGLRVRLVAARTRRIAYYGALHGLDAVKAAAEVDRIEAERTHFLAVHFVADPVAPERFDLTINTDELTSAAIVEVILTALTQKVPGIHVRPHA